MLPQRIGHQYEIAKPVMNNEADQLTFSQTHGYAPLPIALQLEELPNYARTQVWNVLYDHLHATRDRSGGFVHLGGHWLQVAYAIHTKYFGKPADDWSSSFHGDSSPIKEIKDHILSSPFNEVFDLVQFIMRHQACPPFFATEMRHTFKRCQLAYMVVDGDMPTIIPAATPTEGQAIKDAMQTLAVSGLNGSLSHLKQSAAHINKGAWAASVRDSIHAVESVVRQVAPEKANTLASALRALEKKWALHPALKDGINKLYGYTSNEPGIRHPLLDSDNANVTKDEAVFMLGACASFASYLWRKSQGGNRS